MTIKIANELKNYNKNSVIIKKYYRDQKDENRLINENNVNLISDKERISAIKKAERENFDIAILDDGFQDHSIKKDLSIVCFNGKQQIGNGLVLPAGPLRENLNALNEAQIVIINGEKDKIFEKKIFDISKNIKIFYSKYSPQNIENFKNKKIFAFAGIGNPKNFFELLHLYKLNVKKKIAFPDHYEFSRKELEQIIEEALKDNCELVTTEKDFYRIKNYGLKEIKFVKVDLEIQMKNEFIKEILNYL